jgi:hypothetical protein
MTEPPRARFRKCLLQAVAQDERIVGVLDYGSSSEGRADAWSDVDVAVFIRDDDFNGFERDWEAWAAQFGTLLLAFISPFEHPWVVYDTQPLPLRVDFDFHRESRAGDLSAWPNAPESVASMVWYDATGGRLTASVQRLVGQSLGPVDVFATFDRVSGSFWYYALRTYSKLQRGQYWAVRFDLNFMVTGNLLALLRIEADATDRWRASDPSVGIEQVLTTERLMQLNACIPSASNESLRGALLAAAQLASETCAVISERDGWPWPERLAQRIIGLYSGELS